MGSSSKSASQNHEKNSTVANNNNNNMITPAVVSPITGGVQTVVATANSHNSVVVDGPLTAQQRREALKLSFQRSFSEPLGGVAGKGFGVPCTPTIESPPSVSPSLHPSKRCRMTQQQQQQQGVSAHHPNPPRGS